VVRPGLAHGYLHDGFDRWMGAWRTRAAHAGGGDRRHYRNSAILAVISV
jgi:hypothetical protein